MSQFYPGQKIKKVCGEYNIGATGTVISTDFVRPGDPHPLAQTGYARLDAPCDLQVRHDASWRSSSGHIHPPTIIGFSQSMLWEPIIPDGLESLEEINALYEPEGVSA